MTIKQNRDKRLIDKAKNGDREAFDQIFKGCENRVRSAVEMQIQKTGIHLEADEVIQESLVKALQSIRRFEWRGKDSFYLWLCGIARNVIHKLIERTGRNRYLHVPEAVLSEEASPSKVLRREERFDRLEESLRKLSPEYREVVRLSRIERLPVKDIARIMDRSEFAVKHLIVRAVRQLRAYFGDTESLHLPDRPLAMEGDDNARE